MKNLGFIGMGNMAQALAGGFLTSGRLSGEQVYAYAPHLEKLKKNAESIGFQACASLKELAECCDTLVIACKPYQIEAMAQELGDGAENKAILSVAAGWNFAKLSAVFGGKNARIQFIMPNTPAMVGEGVLLFEDKNSLEKGERCEIMELFSTVGMVEEIPEHLMGIAGTVTGCGPAFVDLMMEAYGDAAVKYGVPRAEAYRLIAQMILGSAKLQLETGTHPGVLKDQVCSPAGTTIRGVAALEEAGFRSACIKSIDTILA